MNVKPLFIIFIICVSVLQNLHAMQDDNTRQLELDDKNVKGVIKNIIEGHSNPAQFLCVSKNITPETIFNTVTQAKTIIKFIRAALNNDIITVRYILELGMDNINYGIGTAKFTALQCATCMGNNKIVKLLVNQPDININAKNYHDKTALHLAVLPSSDISQVLGQEFKDKIVRQRFLSQFKSIGNLLTVKLLMQAGANYDETCYGENILKTIIKLKMRNELRLECITPKLEQNLSKIYKNNEKISFLKYSLDPNQEIKSEKLVISLIKQNQMFKEKHKKFLNEQKKLLRTIKVNNQISDFICEFINLKQQLFDATKSMNINNVKVLATKITFYLKDNHGNNILHYAVQTKNIYLINLILYCSVKLLFWKNHNNIAPIEMIISQPKIINAIFVKPLLNNQHEK